ncbi:hypothetical protein BOW53_12760 [Solemya pervernicosa gill symbiont]|uniref:Type II secretion system protein L n=2 Tax=Gammaproteobacteria incertae sedis TaxID=118884 RepID=A0A1T2L2J0_9GAMM|nr:type II secretion system protein GspL [Candidatus Reidiella endopervernicosa]OOZ39166.1 hypothetical protein BOW53_12760 [Solemya pervernicosa gill symbiont]QKQ28005.1 hypothetical protein HUE57_18240 [Candidatus Reidiella endopervernicosa]
MEPTILLQLEGEDALHWVTLDRGGRASLPQHGTFSELARHAGTTRLTLIAPAESLLLTEVSIPTRSRQQLQQALPFAMEEQLSEEVELLHFAYPRPTGNAPLPVAVIAKSRLIDWQQQFAAHGLTLTSIVAEPQLLPLDGDTWHLLLDDRRALLRSGTLRGYAIDPDNLDRVLQLAIDEMGENPPAQIMVSDLRSQATPLPHFANIELVVKQLADGTLPLYARGYLATTPIELLQGEFSRREQMGRNLKPWIPSAAMLMIALSLSGTATIGDYQALQDESKNNQQQIEQIYLEAFPKSKLVTGREKALMEQKLVKLRQRSASSSGALPLLEKSGERIQQLDGVSIETINYRNGTLELDLRAENLQLIDQLKQQLDNDTSLNVEIASATSRNGRIEGRLRIRSGS